MTNADGGRGMWYVVCGCGGEQKGDDVIDDGLLQRDPGGDTPTKLGGVGDVEEIRKTFYANLLNAKRL